MPTARFDWDSVQTRPREIIVRLSAFDQALLHDAMALMSDRYRWPVDDATYDEIEAAVAKANLAIMSNIMLGTVVFVAAGSVPDGMLLCDGTAYNRVDYPDLYAALDSAFILGPDQFVTPNLIGRVAMGAGNGHVVGDMGGEETHTLIYGEMPPHNHTYTPPTFNVDLEAPGAPDAFAAGVGLPTQTGLAGDGDPHNNMQPYTVLLPCLIAN